jgi:hypothetical protein
MSAIALNGQTNHVRVCPLSDHSGPKLAGHLTAPDQCCSNVKKALAMAPSTRDAKARAVVDDGQRQGFSINITP